MQNQHEIKVEDIYDAVSQGKPVRDHGPYRVLFGNDALEYRPVVIEDPMPTGRQLLEAANVRPVIEYQVFQVLQNGLLESLRLDELTDLRSKGVEKFLIFRNDSSYRFTLDDREFDWGARFISGLTLKKLAEVNVTTYGVWLEAKNGGEDRPISDTELIDLTQSGVEHFFTGLKQTTEG